MDDRELWRLAGASSPDEWRALKSDVLNCDAWTITEAGNLLNEVVLETWQESSRRHDSAVRAGRIAGKESARARRALSQLKKNQQLRTTVERPLNDRQPVVVVVDVVKEQQTLASDDAEPRAAVEHWKLKSGVTPRSGKVLASYRSKAQARLSEGLTLNQLKAAVDGAAGDDFWSKQLGDPMNLWRSHGRVLQLAGLVHASDPRKNRQPETVEQIGLAMARQQAEIERSHENAKPDFPIPLRADGKPDVPKLAQMVAAETRRKRAETYRDPI